MFISHRLHLASPSNDVLPSGSTFTLPKIAVVSRVASALSLSASASASAPTWPKAVRGAHTRVLSGGSL